MIRFLEMSSPDANVLVLGNRIAKSTFKQPLALNRAITVEGRTFKVVGILKETGMGGDDGRILPIMDG